MKILVFNSSLRVGGAESMSIELANALAGDADVWFAPAGGPLRDNIDERVMCLEEQGGAAAVQTRDQVDLPQGSLVIERGSEHGPKEVEQVPVVGG